MKNIISQILRCACVGNKVIGIKTTLSTILFLSEGKICTYCIDFWNNDGFLEWRFSIFNKRKRCIKRPQIFWCNTCMDIINFNNYIFWRDYWIYVKIGIKSLFSILPTYHIFVLSIYMYLIITAYINKLSLNSLPTCIYVDTNYTIKINVCYY